MKIGEGNIFEAMRLVLPEHRELMERMERDVRRGKPPLLTEDHYEQMQYILSRALEEQIPIKVAVWMEYEQRVWMGVPERSGDKLRLRTKQGSVFIAFSDLLQVEEWIID